MLSFVNGNSRAWKFVDGGVFELFTSNLSKTATSFGSLWFLELGLLSQFPFFDLRGSTWGAAFAIACCLAP